MDPILSKHFKSRLPSDIRCAQIEFQKREDKVDAIDVAIGNVSLPMHPAMQKRIRNITSESSPFREGVVRYTPTVGSEETNKAFLNVIAASGFDTNHLYSMITDGGSGAMELVVLGCCGPAGSKESPLMVIEPVYTNYISMVKRTGRQSVKIRRILQENGKFTLPEYSVIDEMMRIHNPGALVVIPYDNPAGQFYDHLSMVELAKLCVKHNLWMVSDEAYRELYYTKGRASSIWGLTEKEVPGILGRRISIETTSKVWNACGLRIGALITDNYEFHEKAVFEATANLCPPAIAQYVFGGLAHEPHDRLQQWFSKQRKYYQEIGGNLQDEFHEMLPGVIISSPDAAIYSVVDVRNIAKPGFNATDFVMYCTKEGKVTLDDTDYTLLVAPMKGFYSSEIGERNPGNTQMRIAYVETPQRMKLVPELFARLFLEFEHKRKDQ
ncbi:MAG: aminotransferase class I/II-fold pyridoxal phosphate-dependent enzyme [Candidatus Lokiarchaeota archaeon]|nr:aminotransferase class I/II-fold pyridoxal phosphate-dependent enzyme [Candidatus Lokiarchaeota archaeon]